MTKNKVSDHDLAISVNAGDLSAFHILYERHWRRLHQYVSAVIESDTEAEDIVQNVFIQFWEGSKKAIIEEPDAYFHVATRFRILKHFEKNKVKFKHLTNITLEAEMQTSSIDELMDAKTLNNRIEIEIAKLPNKMRQVFLLNKKEDMSYKEISKSLNISETTVKKQIYNATKLLRTKLSGYLRTIIVLF
jgi:RNA polymerase sigma-70 factor (family 1)